MTLVCEECQEEEHEVCALTVWTDRPDGPSVPCACEHPEHTRVAPVPVWKSLAAAVLTAVGYRLWLGWHELVKDNSVYETWQVVGLALTLGLLVIIATWLSTRLGQVVAAVVTVTLTVFWSWDAATTPNPQGDANLWPVGAIFLFGGAAVGFAAVLGLTYVVKTVWRTRAGIPDPLA